MKQSVLHDITLLNYALTPSFVFSFLGSSWRTCWSVIGCFCLTREMMSVEADSQFLWGWCESFLWPPCCCRSNIWLLVFTTWNKLLTEELPSLWLLALSSIILPEQSFCGAAAWPWASGDWHPSLYSCVTNLRVKENNCTILRTWTCLVTEQRKHVLICQAQEQRHCWAH